MIDDLALAGAPAEIMEEARREEPPFCVWPEHWDAIRVFMRVARQWRTSGTGKPTALDYGPVLTVMGMVGRGDDLDLLDQIRTMESAALKLFNGED